ncbi:hypothetical protein DM02DRAFT_665283 [Periconia macrospinosa]|uniref:Transcription factor domain-containing protein n=1 Tax=Periconia macrospinosa TaxID=97972 RepID=A0A2V1CYD9_9PLEO|nr:hypothetical protein DM02DRAFT_665283 [Periconia macrospinosa]
MLYSPNQVSGNLQAYSSCTTGKFGVTPHKRPEQKGTSPVSLLGSSFDSPRTLVAANLSLQCDSSTIHAKLIADLESVLVLHDISAGTTTLSHMVHSCIGLFLQYMFPNTPIAHERTLQTAAARLLPEHCPTSSDTLTQPADVLNLSFEKSFTLITALCSFVASVMPQSLLPNGRALASPFLHASKAMLRLYEESDLEKPDSTSITIRIWLSGASQNLTGKTGAAWHYHMEASLLALRLRLYEESSVQRDCAIESRLLRANFWLLYLADKSAACLQNRASVLSEGLFESDLTVLELCDDDVPLLDPERDTAQGSLERHILLGFDLKVQIWAAAANVITEMNAYVRSQKQRERASSHEDESVVARLSDLIVRFTTLIFNLPPWLQRLDCVDTADKSVGAYQQTCLWALRSNIITTYHLLKLIILQKCIENDRLGILVLTGQSLSGPLRKLEIVQDFINELLAVPFACYKVQGEAGVERIRRVGVIVLELVQNANNDIIEERVRSQFAQLLDYLARLDSRASDELGELSRVR